MSTGIKVNLSTMFRSDWKFQTVAALMIWERQCKVTFFDVLMWCMYDHGNVTYSYTSHMYIVTLNSNEEVHKRVHRRRMCVFYVIHVEVEYLRKNMKLQNLSAYKSYVEISLPGSHGKHNIFTSTILLVAFYGPSYHLHLIAWERAGHYCSLFAFPILDISISCQFWDVGVR